MKSVRAMQKRIVKVPGHPLGLELTEDDFISPFVAVFAEKNKSIIFHSASYTNP